MTKIHFQFTDKKNDLFRLKAKLEDKKNKLRFSISGESGQCQDSIEPKNEAQKKLIDIWNLYHLNDMHAGTIKQERILLNCKEKDYTERCNFLDSHDINGNELTALNARTAKGSRILLELDLKRLKKEIDNFTLFESEYKNATKGQWNRSSNPVLKELSKLSKYTPFKENQFFKDYQGITGLKAKELKIYNKLKDEAQNKYNLKLSEYYEVLNLTALHDLHPEELRPYKYGSGWLCFDLPPDFYDTLIELKEEIEEIEEEEKNRSPKVKDIKEIEEGDKLYDQIIEASEDNENKAALALFLELNIEELEEIEQSEYGYGSDVLYNCQGIEYYCGTPEEISEAVKDYIKDTVWAFNASFLSEQTEIPSIAFESMQNDCENSNDGVLAIIDKTCGLDEFCEAAEAADGFAQFLNGYDGEANEIFYNNQEYKICRT